MFRLRLIAFVVVGIFLMPSAWAQAPNCVDRERMFSLLANKYNEQPIGAGLGDNGKLIELFRSKSGTSWTLVMTKNDGTACLVAYGRNWEFLPQVRAKTTAP